MPTRASKIRTINRQLTEYRKRLGVESEEYEDLTTRLYDVLGAPKYNKNDNPFYSSAAAYGDEALDIAYGMVTGKNTASAKEQEYISDLWDMIGQDAVTGENVQKYAKVRNKAFRYYSELYSYLKAAYEEENGEGSWDNSELRNEYITRGAATSLPEDTAFWLDEEIRDLQGGGFLSGIERALNDLDAYNDQRRKKARERAANTPSSGMRNKSEFGSDLF